MSAVRSMAKREKDQLTSLLREQADACDAEVNALTAEMEDLMEALAESGSESSRLRWRWSARAGVLARRCDGYRREANRLRAKASSLETQLSSVEAHIASAAKDFEVLREKLNESRRETERARAGEDEARRQLVAAQAAAADAIAAAAMVAASPNAIRSDVSNDAMREAMRKQLKEELRAEVEREVRTRWGRPVAMRPQTSTRSPGQWRDPSSRCFTAESRLRFGRYRLPAWKRRDGARVTWRR